MMHITILTLFPRMFTGPFDESIIHRGITKGLVDISFLDIRTFAADSYKTVDDKPYGGGVGMIMKVDIADRAIQAARARYPDTETSVILLDPQGMPYKQKDATVLSRRDHLIFLCPRYEGIDERIRSLVDLEYSIGDYILTGGELAAMVIVDSVVRLIPGVLGKQVSSITESFTDPNLLEGPQYTAPRTYRGMDVPDVLLSGDPKKIAFWSRERAAEVTANRRPDLASEPKDAKP